MTTLLQLFKEGKYQELIDSARNLPENDQANISNLTIVAKAHYQLKEYQKAVDTLIEADADIDDDHDRLWWLALSLFRAGDYSKAYQQFTRYQRVGGPSADISFFIGLSAYRANRMAQAVPHLIAARDRGSTDRAMLVALVVALSAVGRHDESLQIDLPADVQNTLPVKRARATSLLEVGRFDAASDVIGNATNDHRLMWQKGVLLSASGELADAKQLIEKIFSEDPWFREPWDDHPRLKEHFLNAAPGESGWAWIDYQRARLPDLPSDSNFSALLESFKGKPATLLQVGAMDGVSFDPVHDFIKNNPTIRAIVLEPVPDNYASLSNTYAGTPNVKAINAALTEQDGVISMYIDRDHAANLGSATNWKAGQATIRPDRNGLRLRKENLVQVEVRSICLPTLLANENMDDIDILQVDTEGYDAVVVHSVLDERVAPKLINFENCNLLFDERVNLYTRLRSSGYAIREYGPDTVALLKA